MLRACCEHLSLGSCSNNGKHVPLDKVGAVGCTRCFQYNQKHGRPKSSPTSPRAKTEAEVWKHATVQLKDSKPKRVLIVLPAARVTSSYIRSPYLQEHFRGVEFLNNSNNEIQASFRLSRFADN
jgi:hypothetical protein